MLRAVDGAEPAIEWIIRLCGWSAILFVLAIFFFVFATAAPMLFGKLNLSSSSPASLAAVVRGPPAVRHPGAFGGNGFGHRSWRWPSPCRWGWAPPSIFPSSAAASVKETLKIIIELLAAIPSIVWGFIGYMVLGPVIIA
jgi:phosphate transport system permease protein